MESALTLALDQGRKAGAKRLLRLNLRIGQLSGVVPEALNFAFEALASGTPAEGAVMQVEHVPARFWCHGCRQEFEGTDLWSGCPVCGEPSADLRAGREMQLLSVEIE